MFLLRDLQMSFCQSVRGVGSAELLELIQEDGVSPTERLSIYRNNVMTRLTDALNAAYPVVCELVDPRFFAYAADAYIQRQLPMDACLFEYGADFPSFLATFPPAASLGYLADVGRLEWLIHCVLRAAPTPPIAIAALAEFKGDPARVGLLIAPSTRFVASRYAIDEIWRAHRAKNISDVLRVRSAGVCLQVSGRDGLRMVDLPPSTWEFRSRLADGEALGESLVAAMAISPDFDARSALATLFSDGLVVGIAADSVSSKGTGENRDG
jgi:Putative DNA-binding domain